VPWRGPSEPGEFPTLGYEVGDWIEAHLPIPDGYRRGEPFELTEAQWRFVLNFYELDPERGLVFYGGQLCRPQKWGKDPFGAALVLAEAMGPARFDGWDADGNPVGAPYPTPYIPILGVSEDQTDNTYKPLLSMIREGPLVNVPGMDAGETRTELPNGGEVDPVTSSWNARMGARMTFATLTEPHLMIRRTGGRKLAAAVKRNIAGMDGRWLELTNSWDPTEDSEAQATAESGEPGVYVDSIESKRVENLDDDAELFAELRRQYEDHTTERGGWVNLERIAAEIRSARTLESDGRRYFLGEAVIGQDIYVDPVAWDAKADSGLSLRPGDYIGVGFDGSRSDDSTALVAVRRSDLVIFELGIWEKDSADWVVPRSEVHKRMADVFSAYKVGRFLGDPWKWENDLSLWALEYGDDVIVEFPTNVQSRMDRAIHRFRGAFGRGELPHAGATKLTRHMKAAVLVAGDRKKDRGEDDPHSTHYRKLSKRPGEKIDGAVAATLALEAAMTMPEAPQPKSTEPWASYA
jgi:hypothetical protein